MGVLASRIQGVGRGGEWGRTLITSLPRSQSQAHLGPLDCLEEAKMIILPLRGIAFFSLLLPQAVEKGPPSCIRVVNAVHGAAGGIPPMPSVAPAEECRQLHRLIPAQKSPQDGKPCGRRSTKPGAAPGKFPESWAQQVNPKHRSPPTSKMTATHQSRSRTEIPVPFYGRHAQA